MVQSSIYSATDGEKKQLDEYWKLPRYFQPSCIDLRKILRSANYKVPSSAKKAKLNQLTSRCDRGLISYNNYSLAELSRFCIQRNLALPQHKTLRKNEFMDVLEAADENTNFTHFLDLPPELRTQIYTHYFHHLPHLEQPQQPPISKVSCLVRYESLPIFYQTCTFIVNVNAIRRGHELLMRDTEYRPWFKRVKGEFWNSIDEKYLKLIRNFLLDDTARWHYEIGAPESQPGIIRLDPRNRNIVVRLDRLKLPEFVDQLRCLLDEICKRPEGMCFNRADIKKVKELIREHK